MIDDRQLHARAREAIQAGELPKRSPDKLWGGLATGARCAVCGGSTKSGEVELELEFTCDAGAPLQTYRVHPRCFSIFRLELDDFSGKS